MIIHYNSQTDVLYLRLDPASQQLVNRKVADDIVLDIGRGDKIVGIEILDASNKVALQDVLPINYEIKKAG